MRVFICLMISLLSIVGCKERVDSSDVGIIKFGFKNNNMNFQDVFKTTSIIPLETNKNCLISRISKMEITDNRIFILDAKLKTVFCFNEKGKFLNRIGAIGRGPGEYVRPQDFFINRNDSLVKVYDPVRKKIINYDFEGKFCNEISLERFARQVGQIGACYWGYCSNSEGNSNNIKEKNILKFYSYSPKGKVDKLVFGEKVIDNLNLSTCYIVNQYNDIVSFVEPYSPYIYSFDGNQVKRKFKIDFSGYFPSESVLNQCENLDYPLSSHEIRFRDEVTRKYPVFIWSFFENEKWILLSTIFKNNVLIFNKDTKKTKEFPLYFASINSWETFFMPCCFHDNCVYAATDYSFIRNLLNAKEAEAVVKNKESLLKLLKGMNEDNNPIVLKYTLNE